MKNLKIIISYGKNQVSSELTCSNLESYIQGNAKSLHYYIKNNSDPYSNGIIIGDNELKLQKNFKAYFIPSESEKEQIISEYKNSLSTKRKTETKEVSKSSVSTEQIKSKLFDDYIEGNITARELKELSKQI